VVESQEPRIVRLSTSPGSPAQKRGLSYEKKAITAITRLFSRGDHFVIPKPWYEFKSDSDGLRWASPDLVVRPKVHGEATGGGGIVFLFEIKATHTDAAWWQLHRLYVPVIRFIWPAAEVRCVEVTKSYDPAVRFPGQIKVVFDLPAMVAELESTVYLSSPLSADATSGDETGERTLIVQWREPAQRRK
jgi:hypothetical protein